MLEMNKGPKVGSSVCPLFMKVVHSYPVDSSNMNVGGQRHCSHCYVMLFYIIMLAVYLACIELNNVFVLQQNLPYKDHFASKDYLTTL